MKSLALLLSLLPFVSISQDVLFLNEGYHDYSTGTTVVTPTLGVLDESTSIYQEVYTFEEARFLSDGLVTEEAIYIAADDQLMKFSNADYSLLNAVEVEGIRDIAIHDGMLFVSRGAFLQTYDSYLHLYNAEDLSFEQALPADGVTGPAYATEDLLIVDGLLYCCVSNSFEYGDFQSTLGIYDPAESTYSELELGEDGLNPEHLMTSDGSVLLFCNHNYDKSSIVKVNPEDLTQESAYVANNAGCALSALVDDFVYYQEYGLGTLARFNLSTFAVEDTLETPALYGIAQHPETGAVWGADTDYVSEGNGYVMTVEGMIESSFSVGVSCGNILFNTSSASGISERSLTMTCYPNPATDAVQVEAETAFDFCVRTLDGKLVTEGRSQGNTVRLHLSPGLYVIQAESARGNAVQRVVVH